MQVNKRMMKLITQDDLKIELEKMNKLLENLTDLLNSLLNMEVHRKLEKKEKRWNYVI